MTITTITTTIIRTLEIFIFALSYPWVFVRKNPKENLDPRSSLPSLEADTVDHATRAGVYHEDYLVPFVVVFHKPDRSVQQLDISDVHLGGQLLDHVVFCVGFL